MPHRIEDETKIENNFKILTQPNLNDFQSAEDDTKRLAKMDRLGLQQQRPVYGIEQQFWYLINTGTGNARVVASPMMGFFFSKNFAIHRETVYL